MDDLTSSEFSPSGGFDGSNQAADTPASGFIFGSKLTLMTDPDSLMAESLRSLRTVLLTNHLQEGRRSLAICSPSEGTGCSFLAANLAVGMAQIGVNTLLVDANLRSPGIHEYIQPVEPVSGLSECLRDDTLPAGRVVNAIQPCLSVIYAGHPDPTVPDQIGGNNFKALIGSCMRDYDLTIVDTPATNRYADARRIASVARYAMVVALRQRTFAKDIHTLLEELEADRTTVVGTYLNDY